jgi:tetratricopeptide (TPR) repeat protein
MTNDKLKMNSKHYPVSKLHLSFVICHLSFIILLLVLPVLSGAQDVKPVTPPLLPFQQDAPKPGNEEQLALQYYQNQEFDKASEMFEQLYEQKPSLYYYQYLVFSLVEIKEFGKAEKLIKKAQKAEPDAPRFMVDLGYVKYRSGDQEKAKKLYEDALKKLGPNQQQVFELANAYITRGENEYAIRTYLKGRQLLNNTYPFGFELASVYERMGDFKNAMEEYLNMLDVNKAYLTTVQDRIQMTLSFQGRRRIRIIQTMPNCCGGIRSSKKILTWHSSRRRRSTAGSGKMGINWSHWPVLQQLTTSTMWPLIVINI